MVKNLVLLIWTWDKISFRIFAIWPRWLTARGRFRDRQLTACVVDFFNAKNLQFVSWAFYCHFSTTSSFSFKMFNTSCMVLIDASVNHHIFSRYIFSTKRFLTWKFNSSIFLLQNIV